MHTFLSCVATDIMAHYGDKLDRIAVVFPNKRASLFLNQELIRLAGHPIWSPAYITISELFRKQSQLVEADPILLVTILYQVFCEVTESNETIDDFWGWGETMLADFDDIDKHLADAERVLKNITDLRELDTMDYLTDTQRRLLEHFFSTFVARESSLQRTFGTLWSRLTEIYSRFKGSLAARHIAYEGMLYRDVVENENYDLPYDKYIFVGFNLLQDVEQKLFEAVKSADKAEFYWDYDNIYLSKDSPFFEAGQFIKRYDNPQKFPNRLSSSDEIYTMASQKKQMEFVASVSNTLQAGYVASWLRQKVETEGEDGRTIEVPRYKIGARCAVVLCDETLLSGVLSSLPEEMESVNVTIGFPLSHSPVASLVTELLALRLEGMRRDAQKFRMKHVARLLRHPYIRLLSPATATLLEQLTCEKRFWLDAERLIINDDDGLKLLFGSIERDGDDTSTTPLSRLLRWCMEVIHRIGETVGDSNALMTESLYRMHSLLGRLQSLMNDGSLNVDSSTMRRLIDRLVGTASVPFHGEPIEGVQVMGVLETRNLDFEQMLILSASDGNMPKTSSQTSFIPYNMRRAYGLTVPDDQVAIYAHYFYRMIQRAHSVTFCYNSDTTAHGQNEMSRFMMQLLVAGHNPIVRRELCLRPEIASLRTTVVEKTQEVMSVINARTTVSPTEMGQYMRCPMKYYYINVLGLREPESDDDEIGNTDFGTIFHYSMETIYRQLTQDMSQPTVTAEQINNFLNQHGTVERIVDKAFADKFFFKGSSSDSSSVSENVKIPELNGLQVINHSAVCAYIRRTLKSDMKAAPFAIRGLEERRLHLDITLDNGQNVQLRGSIDRLDELFDTDGSRYLRVLDYKTGHAPNAKAPALENIFDLTVDAKWHPDYYLQAMLYCLAVVDDAKLNPNHLPVRPALLFVTATESLRENPVLCADKQEIRSAADYRDVILDGMRKLLGEIRSADVPFRMTPFAKRCSNCAFASLCKI